MEKKIVKILSIIGIALLGFSLAGCGKKTPTVERDPYRYEATFKTVPVEFKDCYMSGNIVDNNVLYGIVTTYDPETYDATGMYLRSINLTDNSGKDVEITLDEALEDSYISSVFKKGEDFVILMSKWDEINMEESYVLVKLEKSGKTEIMYSLTDILTSEDRYIDKALFDKEENLILVTGSSIIKVDKNARVLGKVSVPTWIRGAFIDKDGEVYASTFSEATYGYSFKRVDFKKGTFEEEHPLKSGDGDVQIMDDGTLLLVSNDGVKEFDPATKELKDLWLWINVDMNSFGDNNIMKNADGTYSLVNFSYEEEKEILELVTIKQVPNDPNVGKKEIVLGCRYIDWSVRDQIISFNKKNENYHITVKTYDSEGDYEEVNARFLADVTQGKYDIVAMDIFDAMPLAKKGAFTDISKLMSKDPDIDRSDFFENVLDAYKVKGKDYFAIPSAGVSTMVGSKKNFAENTNLSLKDVIELRNKNLDKGFIEYPSQESVFSMFFMYDMASYVDMEKGKCHFNTQEFYDILNFAKTFPKELDYENYNSWTSIRSGDTLLATMSISDLSSISVYDQLFDGGITYIGIPSKDGSKHVVNANSIYTISSKSVEVDGAWEFIKEILMNSSESRVDGLPTYRPAYDKYVEALLEREGETMGGWGNGDEMIEVYAPSKVQLEEAKKIYESATGALFYDDKIFEIIREEIEPFFEGQKTAEDVANVIQSRVGIYLAENN